MNRRSFSQLMTAGVLGSQAMKGNNPVNNTFSLNYAPHFGMFEQHAGKDYIDQLKFMHEMGFRALEDNEMMEKPVEVQAKIGAMLSKLGMDMGVFVIKFPGFFDKSHMTTGDKTWTDIFLKSCREAVETSKRVNAKWATVVPGNFTRNLPMGIQTGNVIEVLKRGAEILEPHKLTMVLEPLSDNPDLFLRHSDQSYMICKGVNSPSCKILFDMYHMQRNEGNMIKNMDLCWSEIAYLQIGDNPGRKEPGTGEVNYANIFEHLRQKKYTGVLGMEHGNFHPGKEGEIKLIDAYRKADHL
ncbi:hydroxypyruvate isomerase family protein [Aquirufa regiilacus]|uniref:TIM barrel protein n=1 Tax=Aquirufa regiilacus TaxID=3024868 RepID=A0ABU3TPE6_9BACT|nr:TIM barrel protein [Aquirufa sp. LEOWEIH-7C]MDU0807737.1 TIM barrel protein [Aquirufa sp. LEOWEIH-7C]